MKKESFGARLRAFREAKGMTQQALADAIQCSREFIARLENEKQQPSWETVQRLCKALGCDCTAFQGDVK